jgi:hypothetical protein
MFDCCVNLFTIAFALANPIAIAFADTITITIVVASRGREFNGKRDQQSQNTIASCDRVRKLAVEKDYDRDRKLAAELR